MDPRIREHAAVIANHSVDIGVDDHVLIQAPPAAEDLVVALYELIGDAGATPIATLESDRATRAYLRAGEDFETPSHALSLVEAADVVIRIRADENVTETADVDPDRRSDHRTAMDPVRTERLRKRWCLTQYPAPANAQVAELSTEAYENFVWDAVNKDWDAQRAFQEELVERLNGAEEVRIVSGDGTDVTMSIAGNHAINDYGEYNLPGGEVFTAPVLDSVQGEVLFDKPVYHQGREVRDVFLRFEAGEVVEYRAATNEDVLEGVLETDDGARRLGELGIGCNRDIDRFTYNTLFDEKMGDTVHLAIGMAYDVCVGEDNEVNDSAVHLDMIVDMSEESRIELDGEVIQRDGTFVFEDGFEA